MRRDLAYFVALVLLAVVALPADLAAVQALPLGPGMQLLLAVGVAGLTALAAHVGAQALADLVERWPDRRRVPWRFWLDVGLVVVVVGGTLVMLVTFGLMRGDTLSVIAELTGNDELSAVGWKINLALFFMQFVCFAVALVLGVKRHQDRERRLLEREVRELDAEISGHQARADQAATTIVAADNTLRGLERDRERLREQIHAWAAERHKRCDYRWQHQRVKTTQRQQRLALRDTPRQARRSEDVAGRAEHNGRQRTPTDWSHS